MKKKALMIVFTATIVASMAIGCGKKESSNDSSSIIMEEENADTAQSDDGNASVPGSEDQADGVVISDNESEDIEPAESATSYSLSEEVQNGSFNNMYHQIGDMVFRTDGTMGFKDAVQVVESSSLYTSGKLSNTRDDEEDDYGEKHSNYTDYSTTVISANSNTVIYYHIKDTTGTVFGLNFVNPTDSDITLSECYLLNAYIDNSDNDVPDLQEWYTKGISVGMSYDDLISILETAGYESSDLGTDLNKYALSSTGELEFSTLSDHIGFGDIQDSTGAHSYAARFCRCFIDSDTNTIRAIAEWPYDPAHFFLFYIDRSSEPTVQ